MSRETHQAWREESLAIPDQERLTHWAKLTCVRDNELWAVKILCRSGMEGGMKTTRISVWRGPEEVNCLFCLTSPEFRDVQ